MAGGGGEISDRTFRRYCSAGVAALAVARPYRAHLGFLHVRFDAPPFDAALRALQDRQAAAPRLKGASLQLDRYRIRKPVTAPSSRALLRDPREVKSRSPAHRLGTDLQILSATFLEKMVIRQAVTGAAYKSGSDAQRNQLNLFVF